MRARLSRAPTAEILGPGGNRAEIPVFNAISDHLRKSILIVGDIVFKLSVVWDRIHINCPQDAPSASVLPANVPRDPKPVSNPSRANRTYWKHPEKAQLELLLSKTLELSSREHLVRPEITIRTSLNSKPMTG